MYNAGASGRRWGSTSGGAEPAKIDKHRRDLCSVPCTCGEEGWPKDSPGCGVGLLRKEAAVVQVEGRERWCSGQRGQKERRPRGFKGQMTADVRERLCVQGTQELGLPCGKGRRPPGCGEGPGPRSVWVLGSPVLLKGEWVSRTLQVGSGTRAQRRGPAGARGFWVDFPARLPWSCCPCRCGPSTAHPRRAPGFLRGPRKSREAHTCPGRRLHIPRRCFRREGSGAESGQPGGTWDGSGPQSS